MLEKITKSTSRLPSVPKIISSPFIVTADRTKARFGGVTEGLALAVIVVFLWKFVNRTMINNQFRIRLLLFNKYVMNVITLKQEYVNG